jgi:hypothetical protein
VVQLCVHDHLHLSTQLAGKTLFIITGASRGIGARCPGVSAILAPSPSSLPRPPDAHPASLEFHSAAADRALVVVALAIVRTSAGNAFTDPGCRSQAVNLPWYIDILIRHQRADFQPMVSLSTPMPKRPHQVNNPR